MADSGDEKSPAELEGPKTAESALQLQAKTTVPKGKPEKDAQQDSDKSYANKYTSFPPFTGEPDGVTLEETQRKQPLGEAETLKKSEKEQPTVKVESGQQEPLSEPKQRPRRASSLWFWLGK